MGRKFVSAQNVHKCNQCRQIDRPIGVSSAQSIKFNQYHSLKESLRQPPKPVAQRRLSMNMTCHCLRVLRVPRAKKGAFSVRVPTAGSRNVIWLFGHAQTNNIKTTGVWTQNPHGNFMAHGTLLYRYNRIQSSSARLAHL